jgi:long-chain acyl-CoA synthetase
MANLASALVASARRLPNRSAVVSDTLTLTYAELETAVSQLATFLARQGVRPGDRVGVMLPNIPAMPVVFYGIIRVGAIVVPMNPLLHAREVGFCLSNTGAKGIFGHIGCASAATDGAAAAGAKIWLIDDARIAQMTCELDHFGEPEARSGSDTAVVLHTSGTTGKPKGAELTHGSLISNRDTLIGSLGYLTEDDVILGCLPLFHVFGMTCAMNVAIAVGATLRVMTRFDPLRALDTIRRDAVTVFEGVPTMYSALIGVADRFPADITSTLRLCISGGAALPVQVLHDFEQAFNTVVLEGYGLSETSPAVTFNRPDIERRPGSIGVPISGVQVRLIDTNGNEAGVGGEGELQVKGPNVMKGYWNLPEETRQVLQDGWFSTGDIARVDADGYYYIVDRKKDLIIRGGYNVYPREVEEVLHSHPAVAAAVVVGMPDRSLGEEIGAAVVLKDGLNAEPDELRNYVKERIAAYKYPRRVWILDELPTTATGKILRREVTPPAEEL